MPTNRSQRYLIAALTEELRGERDRRIELELECLKLKSQNEIYQLHDRWQKHLIEKLTSDKLTCHKGKGLAKNEEQNIAAPPDCSVPTGHYRQPSGKQSLV